MLKTSQFYFVSNLDSTGKIGQYLFIEALPMKWESTYVPSENGTIRSMTHEFTSLRNSSYLGSLLAISLLRPVSRVADNDGSGVADVFFERFGKRLGRIV